MNVFRRTVALLWLYYCYPWRCRYWAVSLTMYHIRSCQNSSCFEKGTCCSDLLVCMCVCVSAAMSDWPKWLFLLPWQCIIDEVQPPFVNLITAFPNSIPQFLSLPLFSRESPSLNPDLQWKITFGHMTLTNCDVYYRHINRCKIYVLSLYCPFVIAQ